MAVSLATVGPGQLTRQELARTRADLLALPTPEAFIEVLAAGSREANARSYGLWRAWAGCSDPPFGRRAG